MWKNVLYFPFIFENKVNKIKLVLFCFVYSNLKLKLQDLKKMTSKRFVI